MTSSRDLVNGVLAGAPAGVTPFPPDYINSKGTSLCQTFAGNCWEEFFGRNTPNSYPTATAAYKASNIVSMDWNAAPPGSYHYFEYGGPNGAGHVGFAMGSGYMASGTGWGTKAVEYLGKHVYIHRVADYAGHLKYLGWAYTNGARAQITGLTDPYAAPVAPNQRQVKADSSGVRRRTEPNTSAPYDGNQNLAASQVVTPDGWITGELVSGSSVWFRIGGLYSHSGSFTDGGTHNLADLNPKPNQRTVGPTGVNIRSIPSSSGALTGSLDRNTNVTVTQYTIGEKVTSSAGVTSDIWYLVTGGYAASIGFTTQSTEGLTLVTPPEPPKPQYPDFAYSFVADFPEITDSVKPADWSNFENEYSVPDAANRKGFPADPTGDVRHQWGNPGDYSLQSVINTFQTRHQSGDGVSAHFVVGIDSTGVVRIIQMVSLKDRAYHASACGNDFVGIEIDPLMTPEVIAAVRKLERALAERAQEIAEEQGQGADVDDYRLEPHYHQDLSCASTSCGTWIKPHAAALNAPYTTDPIPPVVDTALILAAIAASEARIMGAIALIPTADQNGAAARSHIVKED